jgi:hypothetical protein
MYLAPLWFTALVQWTPVDPVMTALCGALFLSLGVSSVLGYRAHAWEVARPIVQMEIAFTVLATLAGLYYVIFATAPVFIWVPIALWIVFAVAWSYFYWREEAVTSTTAGGAFTGMPGARPG